MFCFIIGLAREYEHFYTRKKNFCFNFEQFYMKLKKNVNKNFFGEEKKSFFALKNFLAKTVFDVKN